MLRPYLTKDSCDGLLAAVERKSKGEVALLLTRLEQPDLAQVVSEPRMATASLGTITEGAPEPPMATMPGVPITEGVPEPPMATSTLLTSPTPLGPTAPERIALRVSNSSAPS
jgi:hypothetical protein